MNDDPAKYPHLRPDVRCTYVSPPNFPGHRLNGEDITVISTARFSCEPSVGKQYVVCSIDIAGYAPPPAGPQGQPSFYVAFCKYLIPIQSPDNDLDTKYEAALHRMAATRCLHARAVKLHKPTGMYYVTRNGIRKL